MGEKCIFVGYSDESKGYRLYQPESKKLIISRDVIFDEAAEWRWQENTSQESQYQNYQPSDDPIPLDQNDQPTPQISTPSSPTNPSSPQISRSPSPSPQSNSPQITRQSIRERRPPAWQKDYQCSQATMALIAKEPQNFQEAAEDEKWIEAMKEDEK